MKISAILLAATLGLTSAAPQFGGGAPAQGGNGPYGPVAVATDPGLPNHAIYKPSASAATGDKWPVFVWGNGGCGGDGSSNSLFLQMVASHGYLAIASGAPGGRGSTTAAMMTASIDFAEKMAGTGDYANVDSTKIMAAGFSCGGVEAMAQAWDPRVKSVGVYSSGLLTNYTAAATFPQPVLFLLGGEGDIAYANGERDFRALPATTPSWKGNLPLGHGGDLFSAGGGKFGRAGLAWMEYLFRGNESAMDYIKGNGYAADGWAVETHALDLLEPMV